MDRSLEKAPVLPDSPVKQPEDEHEDRGEMDDGHRMELDAPMGDRSKYQQEIETEFGRNVSV